MAGSRLVSSSLVGLIAELMSTWTTDYMSELVASRTVPDEAVDRVVGIILSKKSLLTVEKVDLMAALRIARPDLYVIVEADGDVWVDIIAGKIAVGLVRAGVRRFIGG